MSVAVHSYNSLHGVKNKRCFTENVYDDCELLRKLAFDGMVYRYGTANKTAYRRIEKELDIVERMGFCAYFLIVWDIVRYAMSQGFYHIGRGSGANSVVAYCLKITDVDPIELDLYFERFLNPQSSTPPDFDLDFSWRDRDKVIQYIFDKYGSDHVTLLGATVTFQDNFGFEKLGILSQRSIAHIRDAVEMVERNRGVCIDIHQINALKQDELIRRQLLKAETCGCFYIESPAMRRLLRKLRCSDYKTLVAASSVIRPDVEIESFSGCSFSKAQWASCVVESYQSLYLKSHYPLEFQVAVINNFGGFYQTWFYFNEARRMGAKIHLPCVNRSDYLTTVNGRTIFMGFVHLQGIEQQFVECFLAERKARGLFASLEDFMERVPFSLEQLVLLIRGGAFSFTKKPKVELLWQAHLYKSDDKKEQPEMLLQPKNQHFEFPDFSANVLQNAFDEIELYGFPVSLTWFDLLKTKFRGELMASQMLHFVGSRYRMLGKLVTINYERTCKGDTMALATFVDATGETFDTVHFPQLLKDWPFQGDGVYLLLGKVTEEFGQPSLEVEKMARLGYKELL